MSILKGPIITLPWHATTLKRIQLEKEQSNEKKIDLDCATAAAYEKLNFQQNTSSNVVLSFTVLNTHTAFAI